MTAQYFISLLKRETNSEITYDKLFELYTRDLEKLKPEDIFAFELSKFMGYDASVVFELTHELGGMKSLLLFEVELLNRRGFIDKYDLIDLYYLLIESNSLFTDVTTIPNSLGLHLGNINSLFNWSYFYDVISYGNRLPITSTVCKNCISEDKERVELLTSLDYTISEDSLLILNLLLFKKSSTLQELEERLVVILVSAFKDNYSIQRAVYYAYKVTSFGILENANVLTAYSNNLFNYLRVLDYKKGYQIICSEAYRVCSRVALSCYDSSNTEFKPLRDMTIKQATSSYMIEELEDYYENNLLSNLNRLSHIALTTRRKDNAKVISVNSEGLLSKVIQKGLSLIR